jgi:DNA repair exonuclease SbcCD nuclease subunit
MYHDVYNNIFEQLYELIDKEKPDYCIIAGDVAHTKLAISPEFVDMASKLFKNIADRTKLLITLGNHDLNLKATNRQDAITPIVEALNHPNIILQKNSGEIKVSEATFNVLSPVDPKNWKPPTDSKALNIAVYHGTIGESKVDSDFVLDAANEISILYGHDYGLLGDIHRQQQVIKQGWEERYVEESELDQYLQQGWEIDE